MKIVIIGYGPAAVRALAAIECQARLNREKKPEVTVISSERARPYSPMFLIKYATGQLTANQLLIRPDASDYPFPFQELLGCRAVGVIDREKRVLLEDGREIKFDKLLIASGADPIVPAIKGLDKDGVFFLGRLHDAEKISRALGQARKIVVIGAGAMGLEAAIAFARLGKKVRVVEYFTQILPKSLDPNMAEYVQKRLEAGGMEFLLGSAVSEITGLNRATGVATPEGLEISGDMILLTAGVRPNRDIVKSTAIENRQGICVNDRMETSVPDIYAAGDVAESQNWQGENELVFNWYSAISQGWIAGCNMMGHASEYSFCPMLSALKEIEFPVISIGRKRDNGAERLLRREEEKGILEEVYIHDGFVDCYQAIGVKEKVGIFYSLIKNRKQMGGLKKDFLSHGFNATYLIP